jgi:uncharacterized protein (TIGR02145 family)
MKNIMSHLRAGLVAIVIVAFAGMSVQAQQAWEKTIQVNASPVIGTLSLPSLPCGTTSFTPTVPTIDWQGSNMATARQGWLLNDTPFIPPITAAEQGKTLKYYAVNDCDSVVSNGVAVPALQISLSLVTIAEIKPQTYQGTPVEPDLTLVDGVTPLSLGTDYTVAYSNNDKPCDTGKVVVTGVGNYCGTVEIPFVIKRHCGIDTVWALNSMAYIVDTVFAEDFEGKKYPSVLLGCDCWTAENLQSVFYFDGTPVPDTRVYSSSRFPDPALTLAEFGRLYTWNAATLDGTSPQGVCPTGWRLPMEEEFVDLGIYPASDLKASGTDYWLGFPATNLTGLTLVPGGYYNGADNAFYQILGDAYYWAWQAGSQTFAPACHLGFGCDGSMIVWWNNANGASIRCVKEDY